MEIFMNFYRYAHARTIRKLIVEKYGVKLRSRFKWLGIKSNVFCERGNVL
jgi:hypothetical protein